MSTERSHRKLPKSYVGKEVTKERIERYINQKYDAQCERASKAEKGDTLSIWYDTEHIEELLQEIKDAGGNGLRISFGMCEDDHPQYASQTCLLFNVTRLNEETLETEDINAESEPGFNERLKLTNQASLKEDFNFGSLCPPRCNPTGIGG
ncbi:MAG: hypothetical protein WBA74_08285 [Cyclobacteriaceae bacterium]